MPRKKKEEEVNLNDWYTASVAARVISANSNKEIKPDYVYRLGKIGKLHMQEVGPRMMLYYKPDVDTYIVEERGVRGGRAKRAGKTGPTVREQRAKEKGENAA